MQLLARHKTEGQRPLVQRDMASLHDGADRDGKLLAARAAVEDAGLMGPALHSVDVLNLTAVRAERAIRPALAGAARLWALWPTSPATWGGRWPRPARPARCRGADTPCKAGKGGDQRWTADWAAKRTGGQPRAAGAPPSHRGALRPRRRGQHRAADQRGDGQPAATGRGGGQRPRRYWHGGGGGRWRAPCPMAIRC